MRTQDDYDLRRDACCECSTCTAEGESGWIDRLKAANAWLRDASLVLDGIAGPAALVEVDRQEPKCKADVVGAEVYDVWQRAEFVASRLHELMGRF